MGKLGTRPTLQQSPTAIITVQGTATVNDVVPFVQNGSSDPYGLYDVVWDPGDATGPIGPLLGSSGNTTHVYTVAGTYTVTLTVTSETSGISTSAIDVITVLAIVAPPVRRTSLSVAGVPGTRVQ
jgi:PKD domain